MIDCLSRLMGRNMLWEQGLMHIKRFEKTNPICHNRLC